MPRLLAWVFNGALILFVSSWVLALAGIDTLILMRLALGLVAVVAALSCVAAAFARSGEGNLWWKGARMRCGQISAIGLAVAFGSFAFAMATLDLIPAPHGIWFVVAFVAGWLLCVIGFIIDKWNQGSAGAIAGPLKDQTQPPVDHP